MQPHSEKQQEELVYGVNWRSYIERLPKDWMGRVKDMNGLRREELHLFHPSPCKADRYHRFLGSSSVISVFDQARDDSMFLSESVIMSAMV